MRVSSRFSGLFFGALFGVVAAGANAQAQVVLTIGNGRAHDCFIHAKTGDQPRLGVSVCNQALLYDTLNKQDRAGTYDNRGVLLDVLGRTQEARNDFNMAIQLDPSLGDPYVNLGAMLIKEGRHEEALTQINKGIDLGVAFAHIGYYNRAVAEQMLGRYKEAYYDYKKVLEIEPDFKMASERLKDFTVTRTAAPQPS
jgi:tetratricopeptide (TPR) repeat protein